MPAAYSMRWRGWKPAGAWPTTWPRPTDVLLVWDENAWEDYLWWQAQDRRVLKRTNTLLADIQRHACRYHYG